MTQEVPEGWYADPQATAPGTERWWNGHSWTAHTRQQQQAAPPPPSTGAPVAAAPKQLADGSRLGELGPRIGAHVVDVLLVYVAVSIVVFVVDIFTAIAEELDLTGTYFLLVGTPIKGIVLGLLWVGYQVTFLTRSGATPGKRMFGLRVRRLDDDQPLDTRSAALRSLAGGAGMLFLMFPGAQFLAICLVGYDAYGMQKDPLDRPWHEQLTGSAVVTTRVP